MTSDERLAFEHDLEWCVDLDFEFNGEYFGSDSFFFFLFGGEGDLIYTIDTYCVLVQVHV